MNGEGDFEWIIRWIQVLYMHEKHRVGTFTIKKVSALRFSKPYFNEYVVISEILVVEKY